MTIDVVVVDDHAVFRQGLRTVLHGQHDIQVIGEAADGTQALAVVAQRRPDVVLMDLHLPGLGGVDTTARIVATQPDWAVVVLTMLDDQTNVQAAMRAGARGYLVKDAGLDDIVHAVQTVAAGHTFLAGGVAAHVLNAAATQADPTEPLTARERQLVELLARGVQPVRWLPDSASPPRPSATTSATSTPNSESKTRGQALLAVQDRIINDSERWRPSAERDR